MGAMASQITNLTIVYSTVYSADQRKHQSSASLAFVRGEGILTYISPGTGEFPAQMPSNAENVSIWWRHHEKGAPNYFTKTPSSRHLSSPASRLFAQQFVEADIKRNIKASYNWPLCSNPTVTDGFPTQNASNAKIVYISWYHHLLRLLKLHSWIKLSTPFPDLW